MKKDKKYGDFVLWKDDQLTLYRVKQPFEYQYRLDMTLGRRLYGNTIDEIMEIFKSTKVR